MRLAEGIRRHGFRKWYERELLQSHGHLALTFLCMVGVFGALESARGVATWVERIDDMGAAALCIGVGVWALRRYLFLLGHAELVASQAHCAQCSTYGRLELIESDGSGEHVQVRCRHCDHVWRIEG